MAQTGKEAGRRRKNAKPADDKTITFDYIKGNYYRVLSIDGILGGVTVSGDIHMAVWNTRLPYPQQVVHTITPEGNLGPEISRIKRQTDSIREVEAGLVFKPEMARVMIQWLQARLDDLDNLKREDSHAAGIEGPGNGERDNESGDLG
jgi:hypothetical protein